VPGQDNSHLIPEYVEWYVDPNRVGSMRQWAENHDVPFYTVTSWTYKSASVRAMIESRLADYNTSPERVQAIADAMWKAAESGDTKAAALYLQFVERLAPKRIIIEDSRSMTDAELDAELAKLAAEGV
jgi:hypothetical protein